MAATELKDGFCIDKAELVESTLGPVQNQACIDYDFKSKDVGSICKVRLIVNF